jgi:hypothetical protein
MAVSFKAISIAFGGSGVIFEGLRQLRLGRNVRILLGLRRCKPSKIRPLQCPVKIF